MKLYEDGTESIFFEIRSFNKLLIQKRRCQHKCRMWRQEIGKTRAVKRAIGLSVWRITPLGLWSLERATLFTDHLWRKRKTMQRIDADDIRRYSVIASVVDTRNCFPLYWTRWSFYGCIHYTRRWVCIHSAPTVTRIFAFSILVPRVGEEEAGRGGWRAGREIRQEN